MDSCLCACVHRLARHYDEEEARMLVTSLTHHLADLRTLLSRSRVLSRSVPFRVTTTTKRTDKALSVGSVDLAPVDRLCVRFRNDVAGFWSALSSEDSTLSELRRRLACVVIFLRSQLGAAAETGIPADIARLFPAQVDWTDVRNSGRKYIKLVRKLGGGVGVLFWLPRDVPASTYERYLNLNDDVVFSHLASLGPQAAPYTDLVQRLVVRHLCDSTLSTHYYNLITDYGDWLPAPDTLLLLLHGLGGSNIPEVLLSRVRIPQRRWNDDGEMDSTSAWAAGLPAEMVRVLCSDEDDKETPLFRRIAKDHREMSQSLLDGGLVCWMLHSDTETFLAEALLARTESTLRETALRLLCFVCPPCYEGNTEWSATLKTTVWPLLERAIDGCKMKTTETALRTQTLEALFFFSERDSVDLRRRAVDKARGLLLRSMPYYLHASLVLFESVLARVDGDATKSASLIRNFTWGENSNTTKSRRGNPRPITVRDHALRGRLHISQMENKIKCYDNDVPSSIYQWQAASSQSRKQLSALDFEVTFRLQGTAARFFQSVGNFAAARASLEQMLHLDATTVARPLRQGTRRILVARLVDMCCEMGEWTQADNVLGPEMALFCARINERTERTTTTTSNADNSTPPRRDVRRLLLAQVEAHIGQHRFDEADTVLAQLELQDATPKTTSTSPPLDDMHDQQLHMRRLLAAARIAYMRNEHHRTDTDTDTDSDSSAVAHWQHALREVAGMHTLKGITGFTAAVIHLSLAHALLAIANVEEARHAWASGLAILRTETCEFWIPVVSTTWLLRVAAEVHATQGWTFRMMVPGGKPDIVY